MLKRNWKIFFVGISQVVDILAMLASAGLVVWLKHYPHLGTQSANDVLLTGFLIFVGMYISIAVMMGLYRGSFHLSLSLQNMIMVRGFILCTLITLTITSLMKNFYIDRRALIVFLFSLPFFFVIGRVLLRRVNLFFQRLGFGVHNSLIVGYEHDSFNIFRRFNSLPELGYKIKGFVAKTTNPVSSLQPQFTFDQLEETIEDYSIDRVFIPTSDMVVNDYTNLKQISEKHNIKLKILSPQAEELLKIARIYDIAGITLTAPPRIHITIVKLFFKRVFDIVGASVAIIVLSPIFFLTAVAIYIESGHPIFFLQRRTSIKGGERNFISSNSAA